MAKRPRKHIDAKQPEELGLQGSAIERDLDRRLFQKGYYFDVEEADRVCYFFENLLRHSKGEWAGKFLSLETWQRAKLRRLFGWRRPDGTRRFRRSHWWIPRKNGKSTIAAGVALYLMACDGEPGAEVYSAAADLEQAKMVFTEAKRMVEASPELASMIEVYKGSLFLPQSLSKYIPIAAKARTKHGLNVHGTILDELHTQPDRSLYDVLTTASGSRRQPMEFVATTAGDNVGSFAFEQWEYGQKVATGVLEDPEFLPVIFAADEDDDWEDPATWAKANPNLGVSLKREYIESQILKLCGSPSGLAAFKQLHLNIWAQSIKAWLSIDKWKKCPRAQPLDAYRGRTAFGALDLSTTTDTTAFAVVIPNEDGSYDALVWIFVPQEGAAERAKLDRVQYPLWIQQGHMIATPGNVVDYAAVRAKVVEVSKVVDLQQIGFDPWNAAETVQILQDEAGFDMREMRQGFKTMSGPSKLFEQLVLSRRLRHDANPVLTWMASNVAVRRDANENIQPTKRGSRDRIDGIVAIIMALERARLGRDRIITQGSILL